MYKKTKYWIKFYSPGTIMTNPVCISVSSEWNIECAENQKPEDVKFPENAYAFTMHVKNDIVSDETTYKGDVEQIGPIYYHPDSTVETLEQVEKNQKATDILKNNMKYNDWDKIIWSRWGNWPQPFDSGKHMVLKDEIQ